MRNIYKNNSVLAITLVLVLNSISFLLAVIISNFSIFHTNIYYSMLIEMFFPIIMFPLTIYFCKLLQLEISSIGISKKNFMKSLIVGIIVSFIFPSLTLEKTKNS